MSARFPPLELDNEMGSALDNEIVKFFGQDPGFKWKDEKGALIGPFAVLAYTPDIFRPYLGLADAVLQQKSIDPINRELIALAVTAVFDVPFIRYAHEQIGLTVGLSQEQITAAVSGRTPDGLTDISVVSYETALKLARARGPLDKESWRVAEDKLGREGAARVGHIVAWFVYNCTLVNLGAVNVPSN